MGEMTHAEVNIKVTQDILGSHFVKWILTTRIKMVRLLIIKIQGSRCSSWRGAGGRLSWWFTVCTLVHVSFSL